MKTYQDILIKLINENETEIKQKMQKDPRFIENMMKFSVKNISQKLYKDLNKDKLNMLADTRRTAEQFNKRLYNTWKRPIDNLETLIELSMESAIMFVNTFYEDAKKDDNVLFACLKNIHARAILTARECLVLLKNGYSDGAFSRWRTLYELSIIADFLYEMDDNDLCRRYLDYFFVQAYKEENVNREKGYPSHTKDSFEGLKSNYEYIKAKYENNYTNGEYGWANQILNKKRATFRDIEDKIDMSKLRGYYKSSSAYIHGNFKASEESLGIMPNIEKLLLVGPSNYGLSIPMQNIAISLVIISITFLSTYSTIDTIVSCLIMRSFMEKILIEADKIQTKIENSEMKLRGEHSNILLIGFKGKTNSSSTLLYNIHLGKSIDRLELTNSFSTSQKELIKTLKNNYKYVIAFGQKPNTNKVNIEISANKNKIELNTKFPYEKLKEFLDKENILNDISMDAGAYLCNNAYFEGLHYIKNNKLKTKMIFIHIPSLKDKYDFNKLASALSEFIEQL